MTEHIVAVFASSNQADAAHQELMQAGVPAAAIRRYTEGSGAGSGTAEVATSEQSGSSGGFWAWLLGEEPQTTRDSYRRDMYDRSLQAGHFVLSVTLTDDSQIHQTVTILDRHEPVDVDERTDEAGDMATGTTHAGAETSAFGATGASLGAGTAATGTGISGTTAGMSGTPAPILEDRGTASTSGTGMTTPAERTAAPTAGSSEEVLPLAEEQLEVGKHMVDRGTRRVRRYVVETPVEREVTLHGERVTIERRRPTESREAGAAGSFEERVVEVHETEEVPDVRKTARVVEEVAIRREATERTETIRDTVRRDEVEMAPEPTDKRQQG